MLIAECQEQIDELLARFGDADHTQNGTDLTADPPEGESTCSLSDEEVIRRIKAGDFGEKYQELFAGNFRAYDYDHSRAD